MGHLGLHVRGGQNSERCYRVAVGLPAQGSDMAGARRANCGIVYRAVECLYELANTDNSSGARCAI